MSTVPIIFNKICKWCNGTFYRQPDWKLSYFNRRQYCCNDCSINGVARENTGKIYGETARSNMSKAQKNHRSWKKQMIKVDGKWKRGIPHKCKRCETMILRPKKVFCEPSCYYKWRSETLKGENNPFFGKIHNETTRKNMSIAQTGTKRYRSKEHNEKIGAKSKIRMNTEEEKEKQRIRRSHQKFPVKDTKLELMIKDKLIENGIEFKQHVPFRIGKSYHQVDFLIGDKLVVETDGCYWHGCEKCGFTKYFKDKKEKDAYITNGLQQQGLIVLRFWEHDVTQDINSCITKIKCEIK